MNAQLTASTLEAKVPRRSRGWLVAIVAAMVAAGVASALLLAPSGAPSVPVHTKTPAAVAPAASIPAITHVTTGSTGNQGVEITRKLDDRYFGEPIGPVHPTTAPAGRRSGQGGGASTGASLTGECLIHQPKC
jgi:hypothetical protein